jgi:hypothetical protein
MKSPTKPVIFVVLALSLSGCESVALIGRPTLDASDRSNNFEVVGAIEEIDPEHQEIYLRTEQGQSQVISYSNSTRVLEQNREYPVSHLRTGDTIETQLARISGGRAAAQLIRLRSTRSGAESRSMLIQRERRIQPC